MRRYRLIGLWVGSVLVATAGCTSEDGGGGTNDVAGEASDAGETADEGPIAYTVPDYAPASETAADEVVALPGLEGVVRIVYDDRGIPHIYGDSLTDLAMAQGFVTARSRMFQMVTLRAAASGRLGEISGSGSVRGDAYMRVLNLRGVAEEMATAAQQEAPELYARLEAFAAGVNAHIAAIRAGTAEVPIEIYAFGLIPEPWTVADSMLIARLQSWDLSFEGQTIEDELFSLLLDLRARWDGTPLEGIERDVANLAPPATVPTVDPDEWGSGDGAGIDLSAILDDSFFAGIDPDSLREFAVESRKIGQLPHAAFRGPEFGSNNWVVSGDHTASGLPIVANDTHLALRNPAIFYEVQLSNLAAGGDYFVNGVQFVGAPGIVLGSNMYGAWGATVFYSDVTDVYVETLNDAGDAVLFEGGEVPLVERQETLKYVLVGDATCADGATGWLADLGPEISQIDDTTCELTFTVHEVPHHGPVIPWSYGMSVGDKTGLMTWKWTGFEPTDDLLAILELGSATSLDDFKAALDDFGVGAQNWVWGDKEGNIAWYPSHLLPIRKNVAAGDLTHPPFLPMPGDGSCEWEGFVPRSELPQSVNPAEGYLITANSDPVGSTFDNDPFNDGVYLSDSWAAGFREARITERIEELVASGKGITAADMASVQADHQSPLGRRITPYLLDAIEAAEAGDDAEAAALLTPAVTEAKEMLAHWDYTAASGVGTAAASKEANDSVATSIFNAFLVRLVHNALDDEGANALGDRFRASLLLRMLETPEAMVTWDEQSGQSRIWDDQDTEGVTETEAFILVTSLVEALDHLASDQGFDTAEMSDWRWGQLHTITLAHNVSSTFSIPPSNDPQFPHGFPRPGDNYVVDASNPGMTDMKFTFSSGPAIRNVYEAGDPFVHHAVIPGGEDESHTSPHYSDEMDKWVANEAPAVPVDVDDVLAVREKILDLVPE